MRVNLWCVLYTGLSLPLAGCDQTTRANPTTGPDGRAKIGAYSPGDSSLTNGFGSGEWSAFERPLTLELEGQLSYAGGEPAIEGDMVATVTRSTTSGKSASTQDISGSGSVDEDGDYFAALTTRIAINGGTTGLTGGFGGGTLDVDVAQPVHDERCALYCATSDADTCFETCTEAASWIVAVDTVDVSTLTRVDAKTRSLELDLVFDHLEDEDGETIEE